ncbi:MAG: ArnT family glycosyltransferase, partial [Acidimicrobiales bacterium]
MTAESYLELSSIEDDGAPLPKATTGFWIKHRTSLTLVAILLFGLLVRTWNLMALGFNSDEAVYAGQASSIAGNLELLPYFPIFRAHPLLFQTLISIPYQFVVSPLVGRLMSVAFGLGTIALVFLVGKTLYTKQVGLIAALIIALMPYHVVVTRQILLDGPLAFFATLSLLLLAMYGKSRNLLWFYAAFAAMGLTVLAKETGVIMFGAI